jgi:hypothetical protein
MIIVIKYRLLTSLPHHFNTTVAKNFPGYEYAICKNIGRPAPQIAMKFLTREFQPSPVTPNKGACPPSTTLDLTQSQIIFYQGRRANLV